MLQGCSVIYTYVEVHSYILSLDIISRIHTCGLASGYLYRHGELYKYTGFLLNLCVAQLYRALSTVG